MKIENLRIIYKLLIMCNEIPIGFKTLQYVDIYHVK